MYFSAMLCLAETSEEKRSRTLHTDREDVIDPEGEEEEEVNFDFSTELALHNRSMRYLPLCCPRDPGM
ncbi:unnamed protein product [Taenia asiatica]|uniref:Uncharacterized protein n=1 Tax=Taenia asiatica TaxID=60517 RepID=A0A0R3W9Q8_TAEAS|nr:unnamed protein product [Taenia asiatica]